MVFRGLGFLATLLAPGALGHGTMAWPPTRNLGFNCPTCNNGDTVCGAGGQWTVNVAEASKLNGDFTTELTELEAGKTVEIQAYWTAAHRGHFVVELCANPGPTITDDCFVRLLRDPTDDRWGPYVSSAPDLFFLPTDNCISREARPGSPLLARFLVPEGVTTDHGILRWWWHTGNSCDSHPYNSNPNPAPEVANWSANMPGGTCTAAISGLWSSCGVNCPTRECRMEQFTSCADVRVTATGGGTPTPTLSPTTTPTTTTTRPTSTPIASSTTHPTTTTSSSVGGGGGDHTCTCREKGSTRMHSH